MNVFVGPQTFSNNSGPEISRSDNKLFLSPQQLES